MFLVEFGDGRDKKWIMELCPWSYEKQLILLLDFEGELVPKEIVLKWTLLGSKDLGFYVFRTLICIVGKP